MKKRRFLRRYAFARSRVLAAPFLLALVILTVVSFCIPLRPDRSMSERRLLKEFPEFSVETLLSGDYFSQIDLWFSDTFPGRESWLQVASYTRSLHGSSEVAFSGDLPSELATVPTVPKKEKPEPAESAAVETAAAETAEMPEEETAPESVPSETETVPPETETEPEEWGGVDAGENAEVMFTQNVVQVGDTVFNALGFSQYVSDRYAKAINSFTERAVECGATVVHAPPPTAVGILIEEEFQYKLRSVSQRDTLNYLHDSMDDRIVKVDTVSALLDHNDEYLFFHSDYHWTALGAYYAYRAVCDAIGMEPVDINTMETESMGEFIGCIYGEAFAPYKLGKDWVDVYYPKGDLYNEVYYNGLAAGGSQYQLLHDTRNWSKVEKYVAFGGYPPLSHLENRDLPDAPNFLLIKDSFGNAFIPFLSQNAHHIYGADYRKFTELSLLDFVKKYDIDYVIFMPYMIATQSEDGARFMERMCR